MDKKFDYALRQALTPADEADFWLNQNILNRTEAPRTEVQRTMANKEKKGLSVAAMIAIAVLCLGSVTVYAAWNYLSSADVAGNIQDTKLSEVFRSDEAFIINETQSYGDYRVTLLSIVSGEMLSEYPHYKNDSVAADRTYVVVAVENVNGESMPDTSEEAYGKSEFFASPLIGDYNPAIYNIVSMSGNYTDMVEDGILYRLLECDNVEIFADHDLYLCVSEGAFYNAEAYCYDELTGKISRNENYEGMNVLFDLPVDRSKANPEKAAKYMSDLGLESDILREKLNVESEEAFAIGARSESVSVEKLNVKSEESFEAEMTGDHKTGAEVAEYALGFVGNPYEWGNDSLTEGTDSSGFTKSVYEHFEISLPHDSNGQRQLGTKVETLENAEPGDLIFYETPAHAAIYIGGGKVVHAMPEMGICVSQVDFDDISEIRRMIQPIFSQE